MALSKSAILKLMPEHLNNLEKSEIVNIFNFKDIYYLGFLVPRQLRINVLREATDVNGYYKSIVQTQLKYRYEIIKVVGRGAFGEVIHAYDHKDSRNVAIKIFRHRPDGYFSFCNEKIALHSLNTSVSPNVLKFFDEFVFRNHCFIVMELLENDILKYIRLPDNRKGFPMSKLKSIIKSLLKGLQDIGALDIIHCDLKPNNIVLVDSNSVQVKIIDFGNCLINEPNYRGCLQTIMYRAPEVMLRLPITPAVDMWSVGCIATELFKGIPLFAGTSESEQLFYMTQAIGLPPAELLARSQISSCFFYATRQAKFSSPRLRNVTYGTLNDLLSNSQCPKFVDFIHKCLTWLPDNRLTPTDALNHEWLSEE